MWEPQPERTVVLDSLVGRIMVSMLEDVVQRGTAVNAVRNVAGLPYEVPAGGKTGTTNDGTDVWFIGFTPELVTTVWIGFDEPLKIKANAQGGLLAAPAWADYMREVYERRPQSAGWARPEGLHLARIDNTTGYLATDFCPRQTVYFEWFIPGTAPTEFCPYHNPLSRIITMEPRGESDIRGGRD